MLEVLVATEPLPVWILREALHHRLVGEVEGVLEIGQSDHQPRRLGRPSERAVEAAELLVEAGPVDESRQPEERVAVIEDLFEMAAVEIPGSWRSWLGSHRKTPVLSGSAFKNLHFTMLHGPEESRCSNDLCVVQGRLLTIAMVNEVGSPGLPVMERLLQGIEYELGPGRA